MRHQDGLQAHSNISSTVHSCTHPAHYFDLSLALCLPPNIYRSVAVSCFSFLVRPVSLVNTQSPMMAAAALNLPAAAFAAYATKDKLDSLRAATDLIAYDPVVGRLKICDIQRQLGCYDIQD
jgi:hypothetical protein